MWSTMRRVHCCGDSRGKYRATTVSGYSLINMRIGKGQGRYSTGWLNNFSQEDWP